MKIVLTLTPKRPLTANAIDQVSLLKWLVTVLKRCPYTVSWDRLEEDRLVPNPPYIEDIQAKGYVPGLHG